MRASKADMAVSIEEEGATIQETVWGDMHVSFETFKEAFDATPLHKGCPDDRCQCPHWGYILKGQVRISYPDHDEVIKAGDAYYLPPGHHAVYEAGTEAIEFSPNDAFQETMQVVMKNLEAMDS
jgi:hypothetical protein